MSHLNQQLDLSECELEPLCTLGNIQSHGCLIAFRRNLQVAYASANVADYFGVEADEILNRELAHVLSPATLSSIERLLPGLTDGMVKPFYWEPSSTYIGWLHLKHDLFVLEVESCDAANEIGPSAQDDVAIRDFLKGTEEANGLNVVAQRSADSFALISGYDRVMIYRFHEDWSGQVIAENRKAAAEPYLGLRYPATDIPPQARQLYTVNLLRVLRDTDSAPTAILANSRSAPLDLTYSILRSMSPYHIEYLLNMRVRATLTASLMVDGRLWGMMACHHSTAKAIGPRLRNAATLIAETVSMRIAALEERNANRAQAKVVRQVRALQSEISLPEKIVEGLCFGQNRLHVLFEVDSAAIYTQGASISIGNTPEPEWIESFIKALLPLNREIYSFSDPHGGLGCIPSEQAAGVLAIVLTRNPDTVVLCFRTEFEHELTWGGDVTKPAIKTANSERLSPRTSFAAYKQTIRGKSLPWAEDDLEKAAQILPVLRRLLPEDETAASSIVCRSIQELSDAVPGSSPLFRSMLDWMSQGIALVINNNEGSAAPAFASQALLNQFNLDDGGPEFSLSIADFFRHIGLPDDLLNRMYFGPQEVNVMTGRSANGSYLVQLKQIVEVTTPKGTVGLAVLTFQNITRYARLLEATEAARQKSDRASQIKSAFLANMSHEVRTPMNGILGMAHMLQGMGLSSGQRELVEVIERSGNALLHLVNDILDFSKIEAGKLTLETVPFNLHQLLQDAVLLFRPSARPNVQVLSEVAKDVPAFLIGDPVRLRQVIMNLLGNAIKFTHEGRVSLQVEREKASAVYVTLNFSVVDTGIGIPEDKIGSLFERFNQTDASTSRKYGGTGLGLAICKELVKLMGGRIEAASTVGTGTTFSFKLMFLIDTAATEGGEADAPVHVKETSSLQSLASSCRDGGTEPQKDGEGAVRVLLVDDNLVNRKVGIAVLTREGFAVAAAQNGLEAVELAKSGSYDVILMDCQMPEMDGYDATALIRKSEAGAKRTPIIAVTANVMKDHQERCLAAGMDDFLPKPLNVRELPEMVRKWAARGSETAIPVKTPLNSHIL